MSFLAERGIAQSLESKAGISPCMYLLERRDDSFTLSLCMPWHVIIEAKTTGVGQPTN